MFNTRGSRLKRAVTTAIAVLSVSTVLAPAGAADLADLVLINGVVYTADPEQPSVQAIAIRGNRILATGSTAEIKKFADAETQLVDLAGNFVTPGFNDTHYHTFANQNFGHQLKLPWEPSWDQILQAVKAKTASVPKGEWIVGLAGVAMVDDENADRFSLDEVSPDHPVFIGSWFSHGEVVNSRGLRDLQVAEDQPDPKGGRFVRVGDTQTITGKVHEYAQWPLHRRLADIHLDDEALVDIMQAESDKLLRHGVTSIQDMPILNPERYLAALKTADLPIRVRYVRMPNTTPDGRDVGESLHLPEYPIDGNSRVKATGTKWFLDGTHIERWAARRESYTDRPGWRGKMSFSAADLDEMLANEDEWKGQMLFHSEGDLATAMLLRAMERTGRKDWPAQRVRIEHGTGILRDLVEKTAELGVIVAQQPHHLSISFMFQERMGAGARDWFPLRSLVDAGVKLTMGTEGIESPYATFPYAINHPLNPDESLTREEVIDGFTRHAAYAEFEEHDKGTIAAGMLADIAVHSQNLLTVPADAIKDTVSLMTIVDGVIAYDAGQLN